MSQAPTDGMSLLDPFGIWKAARDANLEVWSKLMIDTVNSDEYSQATGLALEQALAASQPWRDAVEKSMTATLSVLNMPSRAEVISLAERLINVEMRLDDMDAKLTTIEKSLEETIKKTIQQAMTTQNTRLKNFETEIEASVKDIVRSAMTTPNSHLRDVQTQLQAVNTFLSELQAGKGASAKPAAQSKEDKPAAKAEDKPAQPTTKKEEAK